MIRADLICTFPVYSPKARRDPDDIEAVRSALDQSDLSLIGVNQTRHFRAGFQTPLVHSDMVEGGRTGGTKHSHFETLSDGLGCGKRREAHAGGVEKGLFSKGRKPATNRRYSLR